MKKHTHNPKTFLFFLILSLLVFSPHFFPQQEVTITVEKVSRDVFCLYGWGGNIGVFKGKDALLVIDSQYARTADAVMKEIGKMSTQKIKFLINTHYHGDHTQGNPIVGKGAQIISHKNCRTSFLAGLKPEQLPESMGVPQKTYEKEMTLTVGDESVKLFYMLMHFTQVATTYSSLRNEVFPRDGINCYVLLYKAEKEFSPRLKVKPFLKFHNCFRVIFHTPIYYIL